MRARRNQNHKTSRGQAIFGAVLLLFMLAGAGKLLLARAEKAAPAGCSLQQAKPAAEAEFPLMGSWRVSAPYGWREDPFTGQEAFHRGIDLACGEGTPVRAVLNGVVASARHSASYGNVVLLRHENGQETLYAHMQYLYVRTGEVVAAGQKLGTAGQTGRATGAHLHFEVLVGGVRQDHAAFLKLP